jgi:hypothetical protein
MCPRGLMFLAGVVGKPLVPVAKHKSVEFGRRPRAPVGTRNPPGRACPPKAAAKVVNRASRANRAFCKRK